MWTYKLKNVGNGFIVSEDENNICDVFMTYEPMIARQRARLISAAPDLLEACKALLNSTDYCDDTRPLMNAIRDAVRKAGGAS